MGRAKKFVEVKKGPKSDLWSHICFYSPNDFKIGSRVRIFLAWATNQDVFIREGVVTNPDKKKTNFFHKDPSLELRIEKKGMLERREPRKIGVLNADGYTVWGRPDLRKVDKSYTRSYFYYCIHRAEVSR